MPGKSKKIPVSESLFHRICVKKFTIDWMDPYVPLSQGITAMIFDVTKLVFDDSKMSLCTSKQEKKALYGWEYAFQCVVYQKPLSFFVFHPLFLNSSNKKIIPYEQYFCSRWIPIGNNDFSMSYHTTKPPCQLAN